MDRSASSPPGGPYQVLLVFDSVLQLTTLSSMLTANGFYVCAASDLEHAREFAERARFDVAIVDLGNESGERLELLRLLRTRGCRILALSERADFPGDQVRWDRLERKPVSGAHLLDSVRALISRSTTLHRTRPGR